MSDSEKQSLKRPIPISTEEFDRKVEAGEDIDDHLDWENAVTVMPGEFSAEVILRLQERDGVHRPLRDEEGRTDDPATLRVSLPGWAHDKLQDEASRKGLSRETLAQLLIVRQLEQEKVLS